MATYLTDSSDLTSVANAIRTKGGTSAQLAFPAGFVSAVQNIPTGTTPTGTKSISITENGTTTEDVAAYANAEITVDVQGSGGIDLDTIAKNEISGAIVIPTATIVKDHSFWGNSLITSVSSNSVLTIEGGSFRACAGLVSASFPNATSFIENDGVFYDCTSLNSVYLPQLNTHLPNYAFRATSALKKLALPKVPGVYSQVFSNSGIEALDLGGGGSLVANSLVNATKLNTLILRTASNVETLVNINAFGNTPFASGGTGGTLYVPSALISSYQSATNWSTILGYANNQILPIEGSIYETQYADGTPIT